MHCVQYLLKSTFGPIYLVASSTALEGVYFHKQNVKLVQVLDRLKPAEEMLSCATHQIEEYFKGQRKQFDIPMNCSGTAFQKDVWLQLKTIPYGKTVSYRDIARGINRPKAVRAVGSANAKNPFCIIVPCHRVINANGLMGGYAGGIAWKKKLLDLEQQYN